MSWQLSALRWPPCGASLHNQAGVLLARVPGESEGAMGRLQSLASRAQYRPQPLASEAAALAGLRAELDRLTVTGRALAVTPFQHGVGQRQGEQASLAAPNAIQALADKLVDGADPLLPTGQLHALAWLVTGNSAADLAAKLAPLCALLPLPEWCAALRRLGANNDPMAKPTAAKVPRWRADEPLIWAPLRPALGALEAELAQLDSLASGSKNPIARLQALSDRRRQHLAAQAAALDALASLTGQLHCWRGQGDAASLGAQLGQSTPPDHSHSMSVAALLLSPSPITFWQELTP